jgi:putative membrane protein
MRVLLLLALILSLIVTVFAVQNNTPSKVAFLSWNVTGSLAIVLMITFALGIIIGVMVMLPSSVRARLSAREERKLKEDLAGQLEKSQAVQASLEPPAVESPSPSSDPSQTPRPDRDPG